MSSHDPQNDAGARLREHSFDGIQEFDNNLPRWWLWTFYLTIIFSAVYWAHYHIVKTGPSPLENFAVVKAEIDARALAQVVTPEELLQLVEDKDAVVRGKAIYDVNCVVCHRPDGGGLVGPNLTDRYYLHGGRIEDVHRVIQRGVLDKGMIAWGPLLGPTAVKEVTAYVWTLRDTNAPDGKAPEGKPEDG